MASVVARNLLPAVVGLALLASPSPAQPPALTGEKARMAATATHAALSPVTCFVVISALEPDGPAAVPFCQERRPGTTEPAPVATDPRPIVPASPPSANLQARGQSAQPSDGGSR